MAFSVEVDVKQSVEAVCSIETAFETVADVPFSVSHFPKMDQLVDEGDGVYRWEMESIGVKQYSFQTVYACKYVSDATKKTVKWTPVKGVGNGVVSGNWKLKAKGDVTELTLTTKAALDVPLPSLLKMGIAPIVRREFDGLITVYLDNLVETLEAGGKPAKKRKKPAKKKN